MVLEAVRNFVGGCGSVLGSAYNKLPSSDKVIRVAGVAFKAFALGFGVGVLGSFKAPPSNVSSSPLSPGDRVKVGIFVGAFLGIAGGILAIFSESPE